MNKNFEIEVLGLGGPSRPYPGSFSSVVEKIILGLINGKILHLFSGTSTIGQVRVDLGTDQATHKMDVFDFITLPTEVGPEGWDWVIADPPYAINTKRAQQKLREYVNKNSISGNVLQRQAISKYLKYNAKNILWLDMCAPLPEGFKRKKLWLLLPGGWEKPRILNWLVNETIQ